MTTFIKMKDESGRFMVGDKNKKQDNKKIHGFNGFLTLQLGLSFELGLRLRLTNISEYIKISEYIRINKNLSS